MARRRVVYPLPIALRLIALHAELNAQMKIRITEPVFFLGLDRKAGDILDCEVGPYRSKIIPGGLARIPQFVQMPEEIKQTIEQAAVAHVTPPPPKASFAEATAAVLKPPAPPAKPAGVSLAGQIAALTTRRRKLNRTIEVELAAYTEKLVEVETRLPEVMAKANARVEDEATSLGDLDTSLTDFVGANADPLGS